VLQVICMRSPSGMPPELEYWRAFVCTPEMDGGVLQLLRPEPQPARHTQEPDMQRPYTRVPGLAARAALPSPRP